MKKIMLLMICAGLCIAQEPPVSQEKADFLSSYLIVGGVIVTGLHLGIMANLPNPQPSTDKTKQRGGAELQKQRLQKNQKFPKKNNLKIQQPK